MLPNYYIYDFYSLALDPLQWTKVVHEWYYDVVILGIKIGENMVALNCMELNNDRTIVDSGTSNLRFPTKVYDAIIQMIKVVSVCFVLWYIG